MTLSESPRVLQSMFYEGINLSLYLHNLRSHLTFRLCGYQSVIPNLCSLLIIHTYGIRVVLPWVELTVTLGHLPCTSNSYFTVKETVKEFVPVDTDSGIPKLLILLMYSR